MVRDFLSDIKISDEQIERVVYLVGHHHTLDHVDGKDYMILLEADFIANASENGYEMRTIKSFIDHTMWTESGKRIAKKVFCIQN